MEAWFISDIHIRDCNERNGQILLRFLHSLAAKDPANTQLYMLGDIFDLWVGGSDHFVEKFGPLVEAIKSLRHKGMKVVYIEGNHDVHIHSFWQKQLGVEVYVEAQFVKINNLVVRLEHGDLINHNDQAYLKYRAVIRHPLIKPLSWLIPGRIWDYVGQRASRHSRLRSSGYRNAYEDVLVQMIRSHAHRAFASKPFDLIISGHMHIFDDYEFQIGPRKSRSINLGSWFEEQVKVLRLDEKGPEWVQIN